MAVTSSGMIGLNEIHVEAGGASGTACAINESDIRGLIGKASGAAMDFADWYGASGQVDSFNIVVGKRWPAGYVTEAWGYIEGSNGMGSIASGSNATAEFCSGTYTSASWTTLYNGTVGLVIKQTTNSNSGFTTVTMNGSSYSRSSAIYSYSSTTSSRIWEWRGQSNPFSDGSQGGYQGLGDTVGIVLE